MPHRGPVFQLNHSLDASVVEKDVDCPDHLGPFEVPNSQGDFADGVTAGQLDNLSGCGVLGIHLKV